MPETIRAVYSPTTGQIGCVLLQAGANGDPAIAKLFDNADWLLAPSPTLQHMEATFEQWQWLAGLTRDQRVERWKATA